MPEKICQYEPCSKAFIPLPRHKNTQIFCSATCRRLNYQEEHSAELSIYHKKYRQKYLDECKAYDKAYAKDNREKNNALARVYYQKK